MAPRMLSVTNWTSRTRTSVARTFGVSVIRPENYIAARPSSRTVAPGLIIVEGAEGRRVQVIELPLLRRPAKGHQGAEHQQQGHREHQEEDAHREGAKVSARYEVAMTMIELMGITTAARSGSIKPAAQSPAPNTL
jgi:hypothetical protein